MTRTDRNYGFIYLVSLEWCDLVKGVKPTGLIFSIMLWTEPLLCVMRAKLSQIIILSCKERYRKILQNYYKLATFLSRLYSWLIKTIIEILTLILIMRPKQREKRVISYPISFSWFTLIMFLRCLILTRSARLWPT